jgi:glutamine synthetase
VQLLKSIFFETSYDGSDQLKNLVEHNWCSKSQMLQVSLMENYTFEARGYTAWDQHLCIYIWYHFMYSYCFYFVYGEALDNKIPLLRALSAIDEATDVCKYFDKM